MKRLTFITAAVVLCGASAEAQTCTRDAPKATAASYFKAVETDDMSTLATAATVRIAENAAETSDKVRRCGAKVTAEGASQCSGGTTIVAVVVE